MAGIVFQIFNGGFSHGLMLLAGIGILFLLCKLLNKEVRPVILGLAAYLFCFIAGAEVCKSETEILKPDHFSKIENIDSYIAVIDDEVSLKNKTYSAKVKVLYVHQDFVWKNATGNILAYFPLTVKVWKYGDKLLIKGKPDEVPSSMNSKAFDYKRYLAYKNISHQHFIKEGRFDFLISDPPSTMWCFAFRAREAMSGMLKSALGPGQEFAVASMIILGIKQRVDQELIDAYSSSGAMHVLAVSGLHVGMIFGLIQLLLGWLTKFKSWKHLFYIAALLLIWSFGLITAFSPSVLRAVVMFTVIIIGQWIQRKGNLYNTLGITAFAILLFDPFMLMNVGFQMSFLAVFGIAYLHPQLSAWYKGKSIVVKWLWEITSISLCAQLFYFSPWFVLFQPVPHIFSYIQSMGDTFEFSHSIYRNCVFCWCFLDSLEICNGIYFKVFSDGFEQKHVYRVVLYQAQFKELFILIHWKSCFCISLLFPCFCFSILKTFNICLFQSFLL